jgi:hypothetical protein
MFNGNAHTLQNIGTIMRGQVPMGRKWTLNFAVAGYEIDPNKLLAAGLDPDRFICKLTPMHKTAACVQSGTETAGDYTTCEPYQEHEEALKAAGYVLKSGSGSNCHSSQSQRIQRRQFLPSNPLIMLRCPRLDARTARTWILCLPAIRENPKHESQYF